MIRINLKDKNGLEYTFPLERTAALLGVSTDGMQASLVLETEKGSLKATATDGVYPGIDINGRIGNDLYYVSNAELPNEDSDTIVSRLYAGRADMETDEVVAIMPLGGREPDDQGKRVVFYDGDYVAPRDLSPKHGILADLSASELYQVTTEESIGKIWEERERRKAG